MTIGVSLALHAGALLGIMIHRTNNPREELAPPLPQPTIELAPPAEPESIDVIILDEPEVRTAVLAPPADPPPRHQQRPAAPSAPPAAASPTEPAPPAAPPIPEAPAITESAPAEPPRSAFAMRAPREPAGVDVSLRGLSERELPAPSAPSVTALRDTPRDAPRDELARRSDHGSFSARVERDGRVRFDDRGLVQPGTGASASDPSRALDPSTDDAGIGAGGVGGSMDVTEMVMRGRGVDPHAHEKLAYLDRTREQRAAIATEHRTTQLSKSAVLMRRTLAELWASTGDLAERKQTLFELWDECAETGDPEQVAGALQARAEIMRFIRKNLRGAQAYTPAELAQLNARKRSAATFAPSD